MQIFGYGVSLAGRLALLIGCIWLSAACQPIRLDTEEAAAEPVAELAVTPTATVVPESIPAAAESATSVPAATVVLAEEAEQVATVTPPQEVVESTAPLTATELLVVDVWGRDGLADGYTVAQTVEGSCWTGSITAQRADAWRCTFENDEGLTQILDPCLVNPFDAQSPLACVDPLDPGRAVTLLALTDPLPGAFANVTAEMRLPLQVRLSSGESCSLATGATIVVDGLRANYFCDSGAVLFGEPQQDGTVWTIAYSADPRPASAQAMEAAPIAQAFVFVGDTANVGRGETGTPGALVAITATAAPGHVDVVWTFEGGVPAFEVGYSYEADVSAVDGDPVGGVYRLRAWFYYAAPVTPGYAGPTRIDLPGDLNLGEAAITRDEGGDLVWQLAMTEMAGFQVIPAADQPQVTLRIFPPVPGASNRPVLGVGDSGPAVYALQERLVQAGYLDRLPAVPSYGEETRRAVVRLQADRGLIPDGVTGPETWAALDRMRLDIPSNEATPEESDTGMEWPRRGLARVLAQSNPSLAAAGEVGVNVRVGPGLGNAPLGTLEPGVTVAITGRIDGGTPAASWWQVCCLNGQSGWVRADVVQIFGDVANVPLVNPETVPGDESGTPAAPGGVTGTYGQPAFDGQGRPLLYFTFDDGPASPVTDSLLATWDSMGGRATLFVLGQLVARTPGVVQTAYAAGHAIENHTYSHITLDGAAQAQFFAEVETTQGVIADAIGSTPRCLRPPYGATDGDTTTRAAELGLTLILWDIDTQDWRRPGVDAIVNHVLTYAYPGAVVLMHDGGGDRSQTIAALEQLLPQLDAQGYRFGTLCR